MAEWKAKKFRRTFDMSSANQTSSLELGQKNLVPDYQARPYHIRILAALAFLASFRLWLLPIGSSFWLDELVTFWSAYKGIVPAIARSQFWPGQNMLYSILAAAVIRIGGTSEAALRMPSVLATALSAWLLFRLGEHFFDREAGTLAVVVFVSLHDIAKEAATNARPYGIALLLVVASILQLVRWLDTRRLRNMFAFVVTAAAIAYFHYLFTTVYLVLLAYAIYVWRSDTRIRIKDLITAAALILILLAPLILNSINVHRPSAESSWAPTPDVHDLISSFMPSLLAASLLLGGMAALFGRDTTTTVIAELPRRAGVLFGCWLTIPIVSLFVLARVSPFKVFVSRYYLPAFAALALLVGCGIRIFAPPRMRITIAIFIVGASIISYSGYHVFLSPHREDWRSAAELVRSADVSPATPVLVRVGLIETAKTHWASNIDRDSPLLCPFSKYPLPGRIVLLPARPDSESIGYVEEISTHILKPADKFILLARNDHDDFTAWVGWLSGQGFSVSELGDAQGVSVFLGRYHDRTAPGGMPRKTTF